MRLSVRALVGLALLSALAVSLDQCDGGERRADAGADERTVILVVSDGLRWQEVFRGADSALLHG
ncbi:MAG TPA: hypothetical protein VEA99_03880, partial [Gemmatimonadaceae bacterium]|nr:hypothetical protein [Gemmatimonadaceae bacterium]